MELLFQKILYKCTTEPILFNIDKLLNSNYYFKGYQKNVIENKVLHVGCDCSFPAVDKLGRIYLHTKPYGWGWDGKE